MSEDNSQFGHPDKAHDEYLNTFRSTQTGASRVMLLLVLSLFVSWFIGLRGNHAKIEKYQETLTDLERNRSKFDRTIGTVNSLSQQSEDVKRDSGSMSRFTLRLEDIGEISKCDRLFLLDSLEDSLLRDDRFLANIQMLTDLRILCDRNSDLINQKTEIKNSLVRFDLLGTNVSFKTHWAPLIWTGVLAWLLLYITYKKLVLHELLAKALVSFRQNIGRADLHALVGTPAFWLAPVRAASKVDVSKEALLKALGFSPAAELLAAILFVALFLFLGYMQVSVAYIALAVTSPALEMAELTGSTGGSRALIRIVLLGFCAGSLYLAIRPDFASDDTVCECLFAQCTTFA